MSRPSTTGVRPNLRPLSPPGLRICWVHRRGVGPEQKPFFFDDCPVCLQKLADGKVTGREPRALKPRAGDGLRAMNVSYRNWNSNQSGETK